MTIETFAEIYRLKITRDECNDKIIQGRRGGKPYSAHLYMDAGQLCAAWLDAPYIREGRLKQLGGKLWIGDVDRSTTPWIFDAKVTGIAPEAYRLAIRLARVKSKQIRSEAQQAALAKAMAASPLRLAGRNDTNAKSERR